MKLYRELADVYDLLYSYRDYDKEVDFLVGELPRTESPWILDVACGTGSHLQSLRRKIPKASLSGIDLNEDMLKVASTKGLEARLAQADMRNFRLEVDFDLVYCFSSSIQYNLTKEDLVSTLKCLTEHAPNGEIVFDLAFCMERWKEGFTNITADSDERHEVAEMYTSHSKGGLSYWNPLYLLKNKQTGRLDMHVDKHRIRVWSVAEMEEILKSIGLPYRLERGFDRKGNKDDVPIFVLE